MIKKQLHHVITNMELELPLVVETCDDNEHWVTIKNGQEELHFPKIIVNELIEALEDHNSI